MINKDLKYFLKSIIFFSSFIIISFLFYRNFSLFPSVMGDEYINSIYSKNTNIEDINLPSYLYFYFYKVSYFCGPDYLNCVRSLNIFVFVFGLYLTYLLAIKFSNKNFAKIFFILLLVSPYNIYTAYFMPESMFYLFIYLTFYLTFTLKINRRYYFITGFVLGLCSLIKPHAIFFIPVFFIYFSILNKSISKNLLNNAFFIFSFFFIKLMFSIVTDVEFSIFGSFYSHAVKTYTDITLIEFLRILKFSIINFFGIISFLLIIFCLPILILFENSMTYFQKKGNYKFESFSLFVLITFVCIITTYSIFSGFSANYHVEKNIAFENSFRLNNRYYFFIFPLLLIIFLNEITNTKKGKINTKLIKIFSLVSTIIIIYFVLNKYPSYHLIDAPLYRGLTYNNYFFYFITIFSLLLIFLYNNNKKISLKIYFFIFLPITIFFSSLPINKEILVYKNPTKSEKIGNYLKGYFNTELDDNFLIIKIDENKENVLDIFKILMAFEKKKCCYN